MFERLREIASHSSERISYNEAKFLHDLIPFIIALIEKASPKALKDSGIIDALESHE